GAVAFDGTNFALASSTGGSGLMPPGRVGDVPYRGCGFEIGPEGAVLATGVGEEIIRRQGSWQVFRKIAALSVEHVTHAGMICQAVAESWPPDLDVGFIAITRQWIGMGANCKMANAFHCAQKE
ncbi:MAG: isoaspartyl peptidase/L-asparaginase, partial [Candidatus Wildermuthbacteria bacterium]|nr:isoaspartyl peptidase/L-asparaginase [Candidatus Wildermuthbacteria bacterium]